MAPSPDTGQRARRSFWVLTMVAVVATGSISAALAARPSALTELRVAVSGLVLAAAVMLAARILFVLGGIRRRGGRSKHGAGTASRRS